MNKARAMLDALMGPGRDVQEKEKDKGKSKEKFKDSSVCKNFLIGLCPLDAKYLGGRRGLAPCEHMHSEMMKEQFEDHPDKEDLRREYEAALLPILQRHVRDCDGRLNNEKARMRDDWSRKRPPLPVHVIDRISAMKRESSALIKQAEALDDDSYKEKMAMITKSAELTKDCLAMEQAETKKVIETTEQEEVCEICATCYQGKAGEKAHEAFKMHTTYAEIREKITILKPRVDEWAKSNKDRKDGDSNKKSKEGGDQDIDQANKEKARDRDKSSRDRGSRNEKDRGRESRERGSRGRDRDRDKDATRRQPGKESREASRGSTRDRGRDDRGRDRGGRDRSRSRRRR